MYNGCLKHAIFPTRWKKAKLIPIVKPGKEKSYDVTKYRPISLLNVGGKVLEKLLINRINRHVFTNQYISKNQFGFTPQKSTTDAAMALKDFVEEGFRSGKVAVLVSLDTEGAFNSAWWPSIIKSLKDSGCPHNLINLTRSYFTDLLVSLQTNNVRIQAVSTRGCPQGSCSGPGLWNIQYNSLLNLNYMSRTIAFADDLILITRGKTVREAENMANIEMTKISSWAKANKSTSMRRNLELCCYHAENAKNEKFWKYI
jgi:hypothetical protein